MPSESCPLPGSAQPTQASTLGALLAMKRVAVVGASNDESRAGNYVPAFLMEHGYEIIPVNPSYPTVLGQPCYPSLAQVPGPIELVLVFRRPEYCPQVVRQAIAAGARGVWLQAGIVSEEAKRLAREAGLWYIEDRCMMVEVRRH